MKSLEAAQWAIYRSETFGVEALMAVNLGDTLTPSAPSMASWRERITGAGGIPGVWRDQLALQDKVVTFADDFCDFS